MNKIQLIEKVNPLEMERDALSFLLKQRENFGLFDEGDQIGLDADLFADGMTEQLVTVTRAGAASFDGQPFASFDESTIVFLLIGAK